MNRAYSLVALTAAALLVACSSAKEDWNKAKAADSVAAYQDFLNKHHGDEHSSEANDRIRQLQDDQAWESAKGTNTPESYASYLQAQPNGGHAKEAQDAAMALKSAAALQTAEAAGTAGALQDFLKQYPQGPSADEARSKLAALTGYKAQLGTRKTEKEAQKDQAKLKTKYGQLLQDVVVTPDSAHKGYVIQSAPMSQNQAESACAELKKTKQNCEVVKNDASGG
jgi:hypothetical protein